MNTWVFVVLLQTIGGGIQSEAFDYDNALSCQEKREKVTAFLLDDERVVSFYVGDCKKIILMKKS